MQNDDAGWQKLAAHRDEEQVQRDVDRAFVHYPNSKARDVFVTLSD